MGDLHVFAYICLTVYHVLDLVFGLLCCLNFEESDSKRSALLTATCLCSVIFKMRFFFCCKKTFDQLHQPHNRGIDVAAIVSPELNFNVLEVALNLVQSGLGGSIILSSITSRSCVSTMNIGFTRICFAGAIMQFMVCSKNLYYRQRRQAVNLLQLGILLSFISVLLGLLFVVGLQDLRRC